MTLKSQTLDLLLNNLPRLALNGSNIIKRINYSLLSGRERERKIERKKERQKEREKEREAD